MPKKYRRILVINTFGIGDVLFSTPMLRALKAHIVDARIDFMCNKRGQHILRHNRTVDNIILFEKDDFRQTFRRSKTDFIKKIFKFLRRIKHGKYDLAIDLSLGYQMSLVLKLLNIKKRLGFNYRNRGRFLTDRLNISSFNKKHVIEYYLDLLKLTNITDIAKKEIELTLSAELGRWSYNFVRENSLEDKELVGIAPGGGKSWGRYAFYRRWAPQDFSYVAQALFEKRKSVFFLIIGSKEEKDLGRVVEEGLKEKSLNLCGELSLPQSISLIKRCRVILCNDGGILHIAVSQGVDTVSIFGPVDDRVYGPYPRSDKHKVVKAEDVKCRPCYRNFKHRICDTYECLKNIDKNAVLKSLKESLDRQ